MGFGRQIGQFLVLLLPSLAFAAPTVNDRGTGSNTTTEATTQFTPTSTLSAGNEGVLLIVADNANGSTTNFPSASTLLTDSAGNSWVQRYSAPGSAGNNSGVEMAIYTSHLTSNLTSSGNVPMTYTVNSVPAKTWAFVEVVPGIAGDVIIPRTAATSTGHTNTATPSVANAFAIPDDVIVGVGGSESSNTWVGDSDTSSGNWSTQQTVGAGSGTTGVALTSQWKVVTGTGSQTYNPTLTIADCRVVSVALTEVPPKVRTAFGSGTSEASTTISVMEPLAAGSIGVLLMGSPNPGTSGSTANYGTLTDTQSNTWTKRQEGIYDPGAANAGEECIIYTSTLTTGLSRSDTLTVSYTVNQANKNWLLLEFSDATAYANSGVGAGGNSTTPTVTTSSISNGNYVVGVMSCAVSTRTPDSDTTNGSWSSAVDNDSGSATSTMAQYKKVTATGTQTFDPTITSSGKWMTAYLELTSAPVTPPSNTSSHLIDFFP